MRVLFILCLCFTQIFSEGFYHLGLSTGALLRSSEKGEGSTNSRHFHRLQTYIGVSGKDSYGYGGLELGMDWWSQIHSIRFSVAPGETFTLGGEIHVHRDFKLKQYGWGAGPILNWHSSFITVSIGMPFEFSTSLKVPEKSPKQTPISFFTLIRFQIPEPTMNP